MKKADREAAKDRGVVMHVLMEGLQRMETDVRIVPLGMRLR